MKTSAFKLLYLLSIILIISSEVSFGQETDAYQQGWEEIQELVSKGQPRSALEKLEVLYIKAQSDKNDVQQIKALEFEIRLKSRFAEDYFQDGINKIKDALPNFSSPSKQVLHALLADLYLGYYSSNRYRILSQTNLLGETPEDINEWGQQHFNEVIFNHYGKSLQGKTTLQSTPAEAYDDILIDHDSLNVFRPSLYDILAHHALDFYMNDEFMAGRPALRFEIDDPRMIDIAEVFVKMDIQEKESFSMKYHALKLFQELLIFHKNDEDPSALTDLDLKRLDFVFSHASFIDKEKRYLHTLEQMESLLIDHEAVTEVYYHIAQRYVQSATNYNPMESDDHRRDLIIAAQYCKNALKEFPDSYGAAQCRYLLEQINRKSVGSTMEYASLPGKETLVSVSFKNTNKLYIRIIPLDPLKDKTEYRNLGAKAKVEIYRNVRPVKQWSVDIPVEMDHQQHVTEMAVPPLPEGYYGLMISDDPSFQGEQSVKSFNNFWITSISYITKENEKGDQLFYVLDRNSGQPMEGVTAKFYEETYDPAIRRNTLNELGEVISLEDGSLNVPYSGGTSRRIMIDFLKEEDRFISTSSFYVAEPYKAREKLRKATHFFTDRAIYRPGQTIYFKGILMEQSGKSYTLLKNQETTVEFYDANYKKISSIDLVSNDYGSIQGSFQAPVSQLTGMMRIKNNYGDAVIRVEEYKRPEFEVVFDPVKGSYKLNSDVNVAGKAIAYSGQAVDQASVKYRVVRNAYFPYLSPWSRYYPYTQEAEISFGEEITDENGSFEITFKAIPDRPGIIQYQPVFAYTVFADVTDISGETHSSSTTITVSDIALLVNLDIPERVSKRGASQFTLKTTNLNGEDEAASVSIEIQKLKTPDRIFKPRHWGLPDVRLIPENEFIEKFPSYAYHKEDDPESWPVIEEIFQTTINTAKSQELKLENINKWSAGMYRIILNTTDDFGKEISVRKHFTLYDPNGNELPFMTANWIEFKQNEIQPGDTIEFLFGTSFPGAKVLLEVSSFRGTIKHEWLELKNEQRKFRIPVEEMDRGGVGISVDFVYNNESYSNMAELMVPYSNKKLDISIESFRNKLLPGQEETWEIKIAGENGEAVAAELLAGMYDASLDVFRPNNWSLNLYNFKYYPKFWDLYHAFVPISSWKIVPEITVSFPSPRTYDELIWSDLYYMGGMYPGVNRNTLFDGTVEANQKTGAKMEGIAEEDETEEPGEEVFNKAELPSFNAEEEQLQQVPVRRNLRETAFFYPQLKTNAEGEVILSFQVPESLTKWKIMTLAHTEDLKVGTLTKELITQKDLMILPNQPRFFRTGDEIWFSARVVNLTDTAMSGIASLELFDAISMEPVDDQFYNTEQTVTFNSSKGHTSLVNWKLSIPDFNRPVIARVKARSGNFSDGEELMIPVLTNRILVTESLPLAINGNESKEYIFNRLIDAQKQSSTLKNYSYTLEFTSNPAWYAVQALPYLMEYGHECSEQVFNRVYANSLAAHIIRSQPGIQRVFESWQKQDPDTFLSQLEKNQDLKNVLLEETPWVMDAQSQSERKNRIALLFDLTKMNNELDAAVLRLKEKQLSNGGWPWFSGGRDNRYVSQYILAGFGKMMKLGIIDNDNRDVMGIVKNGIRYMDEQLFKEYERIRKNNKDMHAQKHITYYAVQYLYARSFYIDDFYLLEKHEQAFRYFRDQAAEYWLDMNRYMQGMIALSMHRLGKGETAEMIMKSIREHALFDDELGMYWRKDAGYMWYEAPIETQALLIEAFIEITNDRDAVEQMKVWLLKHKQTNDWETSRATADACYALLMQGQNLIAEEGRVNIRLGKDEIIPGDLEGVTPEAATGYFRYQWYGNEITKDKARVNITKSNDGIAWGAVYWQYFENLDKISSYDSPLSIEKKLFIKTPSSEGPVLVELKDGDKAHLGDKVVSRIVIRSDRDMEFVHLKDMRAAALEPESSLSGYRWQGGMGYYESIRDASVNFFFDHLQKGTWVFEYTLNVTQKGNFSNGISSIQCMYAPSFSSHSEGVKISVE